MLFRLLTLIGGLITIVALRESQEDPLLEDEKSPLIAVDPLELEYLKRKSKEGHEYFNVHYQTGKYYVTYLANVSSRDAYFLATYEPQITMIRLSPNLTNCIYDVTYNDQFDEIKRSRFVGIGVIWILLILQCPTGECLEEDIGCLNPPADNNRFIKYYIFAGVFVLSIIGSLIYKRRQIYDWWTYMMKTRKRFHCRKGNYRPPAEGH